MFSLDVQVVASDAAAFLRVSRQLINYWRASGKVKPVAYKGRRPLYCLADLVEVELETRRSPLSHRST